MNSKFKGYLLGIAAAASYGTNPLFALPLYSAGMTPDAVLFMRYLAALPILAFLILARGRSFKVTFRQGITLVVLGLLVAVSSLTLFVSYNYMDVGVASTILFVYPVMVAVIMAVFFKEKAGTLTILCLLLATAGIVLLMNGGGNEKSVSLTGVGLVLLSSLTYALYIVAVNRTTLVNVPTLVVTFYVLLFGVGLFVATLFLHGAPVFPAAPDWKIWACIAGLALFPTAISFACTNGAIQTIGSTPTAILGAFEPVTAVIIGVAVFGEALTPRLVAGMAMIITAVVFVIATGSIHLPVIHVRRMFPRLRRQRHRTDGSC